MVTQGRRGGGVVSGLRKASDNFLDDGNTLSCLWLHLVVGVYTCQNLSNCILHIDTFLFYEKCIFRKLIQPAYGN